MLVSGRLKYTKAHVGSETKKIKRNKKKKIKHDRGEMLGLWLSPQTVSTVGRIKTREDKIREQEVKDKQINASLSAEERNEVTKTSPLKRKRERK